MIEREIKKKEERKKRKTETRKKIKKERQKGETGGRERGDRGKRKRETNGRREMATERERGRDLGRKSQVDCRAEQVTQKGSASMKLQQRICNTVHILKINARLKNLNEG